MLNGKLSLLKRGLVTGTAAFLIASAGIHGARADVITEWNAIAANLPIAAPPVMARVMAAMHGAMHDAVNSINRRYQHYRFPVPAAPAGASIDAAAAVAAHCVLVGLVPGQTSVLDAALVASLAKIPDGDSKVDGIAVGMTVAKKMLDWLSKDGFDVKAPDKPGSSFSQIEKEMESAPVRAGIHFRLTDTESTGLSRKIGAYAIASHMRPR